MLVRYFLSVTEFPGIAYSDWLRQNGYEDIDQRTNGGNR
jgi:hypothetical protein